MRRQDLRNHHPFHAVGTGRTAEFAYPSGKPYRRGLRHWLKARIARLRLTLGV